MRLIVVLVALALSMPMAEGAGKPLCESHTPRADRRAISCVLGAAGVPQRFRFKAHFSGSHDDTTASLVPTLDGKPLACEAGSKTHLTGEEEGDASLECRFSIPPATGTSQELRVLLAWHHAQYLAFDFAPD